MNSDNILKRTTVVVIIITCILPGCEKIIDFTGDISSHKLTVGAFITPDTTLSLKLYTSFFFLYKPGSTSESTYVVPNATAIIKVNGSTEYQMIYDSEKLQYNSDYRPAEGDNIEFTASANGYNSIVARTKILTKGQFTIISTEKYYSLNKDLYQNLYDPSGIDTVVKINLKISDPSDEKNYYKLSIRSLGCNTLPTGTGTDLVYLQELFSSDDDIFYDSNIFKSINYWPAYFSNIFSDDKFNGKDYSFTINTRLRTGKYKWIEVNLQHITEDLYYYLKSIQVESCYDYNELSEAVKIYTNVQNGLGIFGSINENNKIIRLY
jgi:hypothetical protein